MTALITLRQAVKSSLEAASTPMASEASDDENPELIASNGLNELIAIEASLASATDGAVVQSSASLDSRDSSIPDSPTLAGSVVEPDANSNSEQITDEQVKQEIAAREAYIATALQTIQNGRASELDSEEVVKKVERLPMIAYRYSRYYRSKADLKAIGRAFHENDLCGAFNKLWRMKSRSRFRIVAASAAKAPSSGTETGPPPNSESPVPTLSESPPPEQQGVALAAVYKTLVNTLWGASDAFHRVCFDAADQNIYLLLLDDLSSDAFLEDIQADPEKSELVPYIEAYFSILHNLLQQDDVAEQIIPELKQRRIAELLKKYLKIKYASVSIDFAQM